MAFTSPRLSESDARQVSGILQQRLAALIDLSLTLKHIHWNVVGPSFIGVHEMLDPQYTAVADMVDTTAERIATLGGEPLGTPGAVVANRSWDDYSLNRADVQAHLGALDMVYAGLIAEHGEAIDATEKADPVTQDMLIGQVSQLEMFHWFVRAHLEDSSGALSTAGARTEKEAAAKATAEVRGNGRSSKRSTAKAGAKKR